MFTLATCVLVLSGCGNPYALNIYRLDLDADQERGVIQFSDPKLFPREHLINERRDDLAFLESALEACNSNDIQPEVIRELEVVRMLALGVGLDVDPVAARNFESQAQFADLQNDIARIRLEMQLAQLRRDTQLLTNRLDAQEAPVTEQAPPDNPPAAVSVPNSVTAPAIAQVNELLGKVDNLVNDLQADARANIAALTPKGGKTGPIDTFNHRKACRDTVKNVINQTRLDELHDMDGNALVRVQIRATVLPGEDGYEDTLGILRMEVEPPAFNELNASRSAQVYRRWLDYVNQSINLPPEEVGEWKDRRIRTAPRFLLLQEYFQLRYLEVPKNGPDGGFLYKTSDTCSGLQVTETRPEECWYLRIALPMGSADRIDVQVQAPDVLMDQLLGVADSISKSEDPMKIAAANFARTCDVELLNDDAELPRLVDTTRPGKTVRRATRLAFFIKWHWPHILSVSAALGDYFESSSHGEHIRFRAQQILVNNGFELLDAANKVYEAIGKKFPNCGGESLLSLSPPVAFIQALKDSAQRVAVYDVAPAERVQAVSTAARATEALALAASIAGSVPASGLGARGNLAFSRSAVGKADAMELAPIVIGFTEPVQADDDYNEPITSTSFGWLLGPKAVIDPKKQALTFVHPIKPYELYADLSLPGWWPWFGLKSYTAWAPNWNGTEKSAVTMDLSGETLVRTVRVPMRPNAGDMEGLTTVLLKARYVPVLEAPRIVRVEPNSLSPCDTRIDFQIWGDNIWRTSVVHLGGRAIDREQTADDGSTTTSIKVLPDMRGITASVDISDIPIRRGTSSTLTVWTPDGRDSIEIPFVDALQTDSTCKRKAPPVRRVEAGPPAISVLRPGRISACAGATRFLLLGDNLTADSQISVGGTAASSVARLPSNRGLSFELNVADVRAMEDDAATVSVSTKGGDTAAALKFLDRRIADGTCVSSDALRGPSIKRIVPNRISVCAAKVSLTVQGANLNAPVEARLGGIEASVIDELPPMNGSLVRIEIDLVASQNDFAGMEKTTAEVRTAHGLATIDVALAGKLADCEQPTQAAE